MEAVNDKRVGAACYLAGVLFPIVFLTTEPYKSNRFLRFHSWQSIIAFLLFGAWNAFLPASRLVGVANFIFFIGWIVLMIQAYRGRTLQVPLIGSLAKHLAE